MEAVLGCMPKSLLARSKERERFFDHEGEWGTTLISYLRW